MLVNYLLLDSNNVLIEALVFDTEINNGEVPDFILDRSDVARIIKDYNGTIFIGSTWDDQTQSLIIPNSNTVITLANTVPGGPNVITN